MKLFIFAIGGTGSRVLKSLVMQFAAGVVPEELVEKKTLENFTVVPIIIDPHLSNKALQETNKLLIRYRDIRKSLYGDEKSHDGYYGIRIESLKDISTDKKNSNSYQISDSFFFDMATTVSNQKFSDFIGLGEYAIDGNAKLLSKILFSREELNTEMKEGFYGSPNIGTVALNVFQESDSFKVLKENFKPSDRLFFIGSIFGGTGAAGLPMLVSSLRQETECLPMSNAYMGALIVMPYFAIKQKEDSEIRQEDFIIKTQTALKYYIDNLYPYLNCTYYVADQELTKSFDNDSGKNDQQTNKSHFVEFIGGLAIIDFMSQISNDKNQNAVINFGRKESAEPRKYRNFELKENSNYISFPDLGKETNRQILIPLTKFHFLARFILGGFFKNKLSDPFAKGRGISENAVTEDMVLFFESYFDWMEEMTDHGTDAHNFYPFKLTLTSKDFSGELNEVLMTKGMFGKAKRLEIDDLISKLNKSEAHTKANSQSGKLFYMVNDALDDIVKEYYEIKNLL